MLQLTSEQILFEDDWVIAVNKPSGLLSQGTRDPNRDHLIAALTRFLSVRDGDKPYLAMHHRLDLETSGALILAKHKKANKGLSQSFQKRRVDKRYIALTLRGDKPIPESFDNHLKLDKSASGEKPRMVEVYAGGDFAKTSFEVLEESAMALRVRANLHTGRRHQIRAHLSQLGAPILGDELYDGPKSLQSLKIFRVMLHALQLSLEHPVTGELLEIKAPVPDDMQALWERLQGLR
jgi:RluA family pseudouridine synthase